MIQNLGWRYTYIFSGVVGIISGILAMFFIKEPNRG
jgi:predicted MFS family arabinose efflux permease